MRIFFLLSCVFGILPFLILLFSLSKFIELHSFIFLHLVATSSFVGFLLTAIPVWCEYKKSLVCFSILCLSWLVAILCFMDWGTIRLYCVLGFWFSFVGIVLYLLLQARNFKHFDLVFLLLCICGVLVYAIYKDARNLNIALIHLYIAGIVRVTLRVGSVLGQECLDRLASASNLLFITHKIFANVSFVALLTLSFSVLLDCSSIISGFLGLSVGFSLIAQLPQWHFGAFFKHSFMRVFYGLLLFMGLFYIILGVDSLLAFGYYSVVLHGLNVIVLVGFILFIQNIVSLRHSGLSVDFTPSVNVGFLLLLVASIFRCFGAIYPITLSLSAFILCVVFGLFLWIFFRIYRNYAFVS